MSWTSRKRNFQDHVSWTQTWFSSICKYRNLSKIGTKICAFQSRFSSFVPFILFIGKNRKQKIQKTFAKYIFFSFCFNLLLLHPTLKFKEWMSWSWSNSKLLVGHVSFHPFSRDLQVYRFWSISNSMNCVWRKGIDFHFYSILFVTLFISISVSCPWNDSKEAEKSIHFHWSTKIETIYFTPNGSRQMEHLNDGLKMVLEPLFDGQKVVVVVVHTSNSSWGRILWFKKWTLFGHRIKTFFIFPSNDHFFWKCFRRWYVSTMSKSSTWTKRFGIRRTGAGHGFWCRVSWRGRKFFISNCVSSELWKRRFSFRCPFSFRFSWPLTILLLVSWYKYHDDHRWELFQVLFLYQKQSWWWWRWNMFQVLELRKCFVNGKGNGKKSVNVSNVSNDFITYWMYV